MRRWRLAGDERGVTLMELMLVLAIVTLVFGGIVAMLTSLYSSYDQTTRVSVHQREAALIISQLVQDIRKSVPQDGQDPVRIDTETGKILISTLKQLEPQTVGYWNREGAILYITATGAEIELTASGELDVEIVEDEQQERQTYRLTVAVGQGPERAELSTEVARYEWGEGSP